MQMTVSTDTSVSMGDIITQFPFSNQTLHQTISTFYNIEDYLTRKNNQIVATLVPTLCYLAIGILCGLVGNTLVFMVYYKRFKPSVTRTYILAMSVCDLLQNTVSLPMDIVELRFYYTFTDRWLCKTSRFVHSFLNLLSAFLLVAVAFDRRRAICSPHSNPTTVKHAVGVLLKVSACALASTVPYTILTGPKTVVVVVKDTGIKGAQCSIQEVYAESLFYFMYNVVVLTGAILCLVLMIVSHLLIGRQLWLHKKNTAVILDAAMGKDKKKANGQHSHPYAGEGSHSGGTHGSSASIQQSPSVKDIQIADCHTSMTSTENRHFANKTGPTKVSDFGPPGVRIHNNGRSMSDADQHVRVTSGSRADLSQIRQTASGTKASVTRRKSTHKPRSSVKKIPTRTTFMMFVLTVICIINYVPYIALIYMYSLKGADPLVEALGINAYHTGLRSYLMNSFINPLVYSFCSVKFRQECRNMFKCNMK